MTFADISFISFSCAVQCMFILVFEFHESKQHCLFFVYTLHCTAQSQLGLRSISAKYFDEADLTASSCNLVT